MNDFYNGPHGECSEQMYKLWQLLNAKGITLYNGFLPKGAFFFGRPALKMMAHFAAAAVLWCALCLWAASGSARH